MARQSAMSPSCGQRRTSLLLALLVLAAFAWRVQGLGEQSLWRDEVDAVYFATRDLPETLSMFVRAGQNGALYFLALRPWFSLVGTSEFALRYPSAMAGALAVALVWQVGRWLLPLRPPPRDLASTAPPLGGSRPRGTAQEPAALLAALFLAFNPYQLWYSQEGKMYTIITALVLAASWCWLAGIRRGGWRPWLGYWFFVTVGMYTHLLLILVIPLHLLWVVLAWPAARVRLLGYGAALAGLTLPYLPMLLWQWELLMATTQHTGFSFTPLDEMARTLLYNHSRGFMPPGDLVWMAPVFFLGAAGGLLGLGEIASCHMDRRSALCLAPWRRFALLISWLIVPVLGLYLLSLRQPIFTDRYAIWIAPAAMLLLGLGVVVVRRYTWGPGIDLGKALAVALVLYVLGFWLVAGWQQKTLPTKYDLRSGVRYVAERRSPDALLILQIPHLRYAYQYYTSDFGPRPFTGGDERLGAWREGVYTNWGQPDEIARQEVDRQMRQATAGYRDVWVLRSEVEMWDQRHLMDEWLAAHGTLVERADFHGVQVRRYELAGQ
ncbi:MAG TPA: glycosyltransferase family 39 protein [Caldilineaceae bacterium]|nr:glycosyltransferase family 39 protein [Caldilineaceae bacterium]